MVCSARRVFVVGGDVTHRDDEDHGPDRDDDDTPETPLDEPPPPRVEDPPPQPDEKGPYVVSNWP
jgi:hypothetical protein